MKVLRHAVNLSETLCADAQKLVAYDSVSYEMFVSTKALTVLQSQTRGFTDSEHIEM